MPHTQTEPHREIKPRPSKPEALRLQGAHVFLIGIGGSGMSGLARMLASRGAMVSGSDRESSIVIDALQRENIEVTFDQTTQWLPAKCDLVIASAAVRPDHPQWLEAETRGVPVMLYAEALGKCMLGRTGIAIAGTHGKSTTTAMLGCALTDAQLDPTVIVGATSSQLTHGALASPTVIGCRTGDATPGATGFRLGSATIPTGALEGKPGFLVAEACEYNRSFHNFRPQFASIASVEADHLDVYGTLEAVIESFHEFASLLPAGSEGGKLLIAHDGAHRREVTAGLACEVHTIGFSPEADFVLDFDPTTRQVALTHERKTIARWVMSIPGAHMAFNAGVAMTLATWAGADPLRVAASLANFRGVDRRMQLLGEKQVGTGQVRVFDDYGHHPTEVDCTLRALREAERPEDRGGRLICVFQPHQHSRTRHLLEEFASAFTHADIVIVPPIYFVRDSEEEKQKVTAGDLVDRLRAKNIRAMHLHPFEAIVEQLDHLCKPNDLVVVMGAGPVWKIGQAYLQGGGSQSA
jgi:UDP-N-acetylmuramate--alanine ligase